MARMVMNSIRLLWDNLFGLLVLAASVLPLVARSTLFRRSRRGALEVVLGPTPLINSKYHAKALRAAGIKARTLVRGFYRKINNRADFDEVFGVAKPGASFLARLSCALLSNARAFLDVAWNADVVIYYFDGAFLCPRGPVRWLEVPFFRLCGKVIVALPYGSDITAIGDSLSVVRRYVTQKHYPDQVFKRRLITRQIDHFEKHASIIIGGLSIGPDHMQRMDYLLPVHFCLDEEQWAPSYGPKRSHGEPFRVLHAPNHRIIKGTQFLEAAVAQLQEEGLPIELVILQGVQNEELREIMASCHVVAEQFHMGWHGLTGLEGMSCGKPVMAYLRPDLKQLYSCFSFAATCPVVNVSVDQIASCLRELYLRPDECEEIGRASRKYVEQFHSLSAMGGFLSGVIRKELYGAAFDPDNYWRQRTLP